MTVKTYLDRSRIHGIGLFADQCIPKGTAVWIFNGLVDLVFDESNWERLKEELSPMSFQTITRYSYKEKGCYTLCLDNAQFMNHSATEDNVMQDRSANVMLAKKDIEQGEELLCDYFSYSDGDDHHIVKLLN